MAYIDTKDVKAIREALKAEFGKDFKFSVTRDHYSGVRIAIMSGVANFYDGELDTTESTVVVYTSLMVMHRLIIIIHTFMVLMKNCSLRFQRLHTLHLVLLAVRVTTVMTIRCLTISIVLTM